MLSILGSSKRLCDGLTRRDLMHVGGLGTLGLGPWGPIALGADIVMHSTTKYIGGHSDVLGGSLTFAAKNEFFDKVKNIQETGGAVPSPFDCFLLLRSIKTLAYRIKGHCENAEK